MHRDYLPGDTWGMNWSAYQRLGAANGSARLTAADVRVIKNLHGTATAVSLAREYKVTHATISHIWTGTRWGHLGV